MGMRISSADCSITGSAAEIDDGLANCAKIENNKDAD